LQVNKIVQRSKILLLFTIVFISGFVTIGYFYRHAPFRFVAAAAQTEDDEHNEEDGNDFLPAVNDPNLKVEKVFEGLRFPTKMAFLGPNDILVLEKDNGTVQRIVNGKMLPEPILDVNVANKFERGMLGIAVAKHNNDQQQQQLQQHQQEQGNDADIGSSSNSNNDNSGLIGIIRGSGNTAGSAADRDATPGPHTSSCIIQNLK
jgi:glucose/arabinose dehydrogenase